MVRLIYLKFIKNFNYKTILIIKLIYIINLLFNHTDNNLCFVKKNLDLDVSLPTNDYSTASLINPEYHLVDSSCDEGN